jgi:hypothetical protein
MDFRLPCPSVQAGTSLSQTVTVGGVELCSVNRKFIISFLLFINLGTSPSLFGWQNTMPFFLATNVLE